MSREKLLERIEGKREELTDLTCELVKIPTVNPPGDAYTDCARFLGTRLEKRGFEVGYHRAEGTPGDNDRYPRTNLVASCLLYTSPSPRDVEESRMPSSA